MAHDHVAIHANKRSFWSADALVRRMRGGPELNSSAHFASTMTRNCEQNLGLSQGDAGLLVCILDHPQGAQLRSG